MVESRQSIQSLDHVTRSADNVTVKKIRPVAVARHSIPKVLPDNSPLLNR